MSNRHILKDHTHALCGLNAEAVGRNWTANTSACIASFRKHEYCVHCIEALPQEMLQSIHRRNPFWDKPVTTEDLDDRLDYENKLKEGISESEFRKHYEGTWNTIGEDEEESE